MIIADSRLGRLRHHTRARDFEPELADVMTWIFLFSLTTLSQHQVVAQIFIVRPVGVSLTPLRQLDPLNHNVY